MNRERRYDIDWIRVIVFDILIIYHVGMFFVPWEWHIKNNDIVEWTQYPMRFINQWRIPILFVVSGMGTRFALSYRSGGQYIRERLSRLLIPLIAGILIIVPPQVYIERITQSISYGSFLEFYPQFFNGIYPKGNLSWHHLWFLPYLLFMSIIATPIFITLRKPNNYFVRQVNRLFKSQPILIYLAVIPLAIIEYTLADKFPKTHAFVGDWYNLAFNFLLFIIGYLLICSRETFWTAVNKVRLLSLITGVLAFTFLAVNNFDNIYFNFSSHSLTPFIKSINTWSWILVIFGYSARYLNKESSLIKYRNKAVYPFYILHQTITVICGYFLINIPIHYSLKMLIMIIATFGISWIIYEFIILKIRLFQPLFGIKNRKVNSGKSL